MSTERGLYLGGKAVQTGDLLTVQNPYSGEEVCRVHRAGEKEIEEALQISARGAGAMKRLPIYRRREILSKTSRMILERKEEFARVMAEEAGKPIRAARAEVDRCVFTFQTGAEESGRITGEILPMDLVPWAEQVTGLVKRFPIGTIVAITPFNFPLNLVAHKLSPAFAAGNSVILKPSSETPVTSLMLADVLYECGLPPEALSVLPMKSSTLAPLLISDPRPAMVTFTGSPAVGWPLKGLAGKKRVTLELGGNAGVIVHNDADPVDAAAKCLTGGYSYAGQSCISVQRIFAHEDLYSTFKETFLQGVRQLSTGNPLEETTDVGPLITESEAKRVDSWIQEAEDHGANILCGGARDGNLLQPAVLENVDPSLAICRKEVFGPVTLLFPYSDFSDAMKRVNDSEYGLQAGVFTRNMDRVHRAFQELEVGGVVINNASAYRVDHQPYGGVKNSGFGREGIRYAIEEMTEIKVLLFSEPGE